MSEVRGVSEVRGRSMCTEVRGVSESESEVCQISEISLCVQRSKVCQSQSPRCVRVRGVSEVRGQSVYRGKRCVQRCTEMYRFENNEAFWLVV